MSKGQSSEVVVLWILCDNRSAFGFVGKLVATCFFVVTNLSILQAGYPSNPRLWFERKNVFRYLLYNSQYKKKSPSGGLRGDSFFPCPVHASAAFLADSTGMVWEFGQTCEAAGNGIKNIFFFIVLLLPCSPFPTSVNFPIPVLTIQNFSNQLSTFLSHHRHVPYVLTKQRSYLIKE